MGACRGQVLDIPLGDRRDLCRLHFRYGVCHGLVHALPVSLGPLEVGGLVGLAYCVSCTPNPAVKAARVFRT